VRSVERDTKRVYEITAAGRDESTRRVEEAGGTRIRRWIPAHAEMISGLYLIATAAMMWIDPRT
jgi:DNA-binding PadR family transcriptional regulator